MCDAPTDAVEMPGYFLPEDMHERLRDLVDELQLMVALTATGEAIDGEVLLMEFKRAALAGSLHGVQERIDRVLQACRYPAELIEEQEEEEQEESP